MTSIITEKESLTSELKKYIENYSKYEVYKKNSYIMDSEDTLEKFFIIIEGKVKVSRINFHTGREQILYILSKGDMYDIVSLMDGNMNENIVSTIEDTKIISFPINIARNIFKSNLNFNQFLLTYAAKQIRHVESLLTDISLLNTEQRFIKLLIDHINNDTGQLELINGLSHEDIASILGSVRKVINRDINNLKEEGLIEVKRKDIIIINKNKLIEKIE